MMSYFAAKLHINMLIMMLASALVMSTAARQQQLSVCFKKASFLQGTCLIQDLRLLPATFIPKSAHLIYLLYIPRLR